jgi:NADPH-dependent curcumin reductase CurA
VFDAVCDQLNRGSRITLCGMIAHYGGDMVASRQHWMARVAPLESRLGVVVHPLFVGDFVSSHQASFLEEMGEYVSQGEIVYREDRWDGLARAPEAFSAMLAGRNFGKTMIVVRDEDEPQAG